MFINVADGSRQPYELDYILQIIRSRTVDQVLNLFHSVACHKILHQVNKQLLWGIECCRFYANGNLITLGLGCVIKIITHNSLQ